MREISVTRVIHHPPERVFAFLSDLRNHWRLEHRFVALEELHGDAAGGRVRMRGPLGIHRTARTRVVRAEEPRAGRAALRGRAELTGGTVGVVRWDIVGTGGDSIVTLAATAERASFVDRVLLLLGGAWWLRRILARALANLDTQLE
jgi:hypothetical protein